MAPPRGQMFYIGLYKENVTKSSSLKPERLDYQVLSNYNPRLPSFVKL